MLYYPCYFLDSHESEGSRPMKWIKFEDQEPEKEGLYYFLSLNSINELLPSFGYFDPKKKKKRWCDYLLLNRKEEDMWHDQVKYWMKIEMPEKEDER